MTSPSEEKRRDQWLIRTAQNVIWGPYTRKQVCEFIQQGKLRLNDEVCNANHYWFYLHENDEIKAQLGIELPKQLYASPEEPTQTETETDIGLVDEAAIQTHLPTQESEQDLELTQAIEDIGENTAVISNRAFRDFRRSKKPEPTFPPASVHVVTPEHPVRPTGPSGRAKITERRIPAVERSKLVHFITYLMMIGAIALLASVIRLLHQQPGP